MSPSGFRAERSSHGPAARIAARFPPPSFAGRGPPPPRTPPRSALRADGHLGDFLHGLLSRGRSVRRLQVERELRRQLGDFLGEAGECGFIAGGF